MADTTTTAAPTTTMLVYMDATDYSESLGTGWNGVLVYPNERSVIYNSKCVSSCGIVELKVEFSKSIKTGTANYFRDISLSDVENQTKVYWDWQKAILVSWKAHREMLLDKIKILDKQIRAKEDEIKAAK